jgi:hypothetical protein
MLPAPPTMWMVDGWPIEAGASRRVRRRRIWRNEAGSARPSFHEDGRNPRRRQPFRLLLAPPLRVGGPRVAAPRRSHRFPFGVQPLAAQLFKTGADGRKIVGGTGSRHALLHSTGQSMPFEKGGGMVRDHRRRCKPGLETAWERRERRAGATAVVARPAERADTPRLPRHSCRWPRARTAHPLERLPLRRPGHPNRRLAIPGAPRMISDLVEKASAETRREVPAPGATGF